VPACVSTYAFLYRNPVPEPPLIDYRGEEPPYRQVAAWFRDRISAGDLRPRQVLPSEKEIMGTFGVGRSTARKAVEVLRAEGLIYTVPQRGSYVAQR
jgi:DNA-binding GntR family transcriptional regulator